MIGKCTALALLVGLSTAGIANAAQPSTTEQVRTEATTAAPVSSDGHLATEVRRVIGQASGINVSRVAVTANGGKVTLLGSAPTEEEIARVQRLASRVSGVTDVTSHLTVRASGRGS